MPPTIEDRFADIQRSIAQIERIVFGRSFEAFRSDDISRAAAERFLEIICEASRRLPDDVKTREPAIPWRKMVDFGNILRHAYHTTRTELVWDIIQNDLPALKVFIERQTNRPGS